MSKHLTTKLTKKINLVNSKLSPSFTIKRRGVRGEVIKHKPSLNIYLIY